MNLETLISPVLSLLCEYSSFKQKGYEVSENIILSEIRAELNSIVQRCANAPLLYQQYLSIEKPLIFFIDYTIKEGGFSFSGSYKELARSFNELSGDDKFFDLLKSATDLKEDKEIIKIFYLLMGLGFDGVYKRNRADMVEIMQNTSVLLPKPLDFNHTLITPELLVDSDLRQEEQTHFYQKTKFWVSFFVVFAIISIICNWVALDYSVSGFVNAVDEAAKSSRFIRTNLQDSLVSQDYSDSQNLSNNAQSFSDYELNPEQNAQLPGDDEQAPGDTVMPPIENHQVSVNSKQYAHDSEQSTADSKENSTDSEQSTADSKENSTDSEQNSAENKQDHENR